MAFLNNIDINISNYFFRLIRYITGKLSKYFKSPANRVR